MNRKYELFPKHEMKITVFQALTLLANKYRDDLDNDAIYQTIQSLYLSGVRSYSDAGTLDDLLEDPCLAGFIITTSKSDINDDPVRRYFESHLSHQTLITSLDLLDKEQLQNHLNSILNLLYVDDRAEVLEIMENKYHQYSINEYSEGVRNLNKSDSYQSFKPDTGSGPSTPNDIFKDRKKKMALMAQCMQAAAFVNAQIVPAKDPLNIYHKRGSIYDPIHRGRETRRDPDTGLIQTVLPNTLGIMRSFMPLPIDDALFSEKPSRYYRPADLYTYAKGSFQWPNRTFYTRVTPFVSSISGTLLMKLKVIDQLIRRHEFVYMDHENNKVVDIETFAQYLKSFIAYMLYQAGGHSLDEYFGVLELIEVQNEFKQIPHFSSLTLNRLFKDSNVEAFDAALDLTIQYNNMILMKKCLHHDLKINDQLTSMINNRLKKTSRTPDYVGSIILNFGRHTSSYSITDPSVVSASLLFAFIRLLSEKPKSYQKPDDIRLRLKQLILVTFLVAIVKAVGAKVNQEKRVITEANASSKRIGPLLGSITEAILNYSIFTPPKEASQRRHERPLMPKVNEAANVSSVEI